MKHRFDPFERVLVRNSDGDEWRARHFDVYKQNQKQIVYACTDGICYEQCLPYVGNEELHGTTNAPEPEAIFSFGQKVVVWEYETQKRWARYISKVNTDSHCVLCDGHELPTYWKHCEAYSW